MYSGTKESLRTSLPGRLAAGSNMCFVENLEAKAAEIVEQLPGDFAKQDKHEGNNLSDHHFSLGTDNVEIWKMFSEMMKEQNTMMISHMQ